MCKGEGVRCADDDVFVIKHDAQLFTCNLHNKNRPHTLRHAGKYLGNTR